MAAPQGNQFWTLRSSHGRKPIFSDPDDLWEAACEFFAWAEDNPLLEAKAFAYQGEVTVATLPKMRAMTLDSLLLFIDLSDSAWRDYKVKEGFGEVVTRIERTMRGQKFAGAAADLLNADIIARDLGLADKSELTGKDGGPIETKDMSDNELARRIAFALAKGLAQKPVEPE